MADTNRQSKQHAEALKLADQGRHEEALAILREHLLRVPADGEALNDAGALLHALGRYDEAARHLRMAAAQLPERSAQPLENLAEVYLAAGRGSEAAALLNDLAAAGALTPEIANRTAAVLLEQHDCANAMEVLIRSAELDPQVDHLPEIMAQVRRLRPKVGLIPGPDLRELPDGLGDFVGRRFEARTFGGAGKGDLDEFLAWCDIAWFEGCSTDAVLASRSPKPPRSILRVGCREAYGPLLGRVDWAGIDLLVTSGGREVQEFLTQRLPDLARAGRIGHVPRGVAVEALPFTRRPPGLNLACLGDLSFESNPVLLLECFRALHELEPKARLFFAGYFRDDLLEACLAELLADLGLREAVFLEGWQENLPAWLADKQYVVSAGVHDDGLGIAEAMAMGLKPVIHPFPGAKDLYGEEALFRTADEFCRRVLDEPHDPPAYRRVVEANFAVTAAQSRANELLLRLEKLLAEPRPDGGEVAAPLDPQDGGAAAEHASPHWAGRTSR